MSDLFTIRPGIGIGELRFGATREEAREILGDPTEILQGEESEDSEIWVYEELALALSFAPEEEHRFVSCETFHRRAALAGEPLVGLDRSRALAVLEESGAGTPEWLEDEADQTARLFVPDSGLHLWFDKGAVESVGWSVLVSETETMWPGVEAES